MSLKGPVAVAWVSKRPGVFTGKVYNLKIRASECYYVGKTGVVVRDW